MYRVKARSLQGGTKAQADGGIFEAGKFWPGCLTCVPSWGLVPWLSSQTDGNPCRVARQIEQPIYPGVRGPLGRIVERLRQRWPGLQILLRADSAYAREEILAWCENNGVDYAIGLARNSRLVEDRPGVG